MFENIVAVKSGHGSSVLCAELVRRSLFHEVTPHHIVLFHDAGSACCAHRLLSLQGLLQMSSGLHVVCICQKVSEECIGFDCISCRN